MLRELVSNEIFTILLVISLLLIASARIAYPKRFNDFAFILVNYKYSNAYIKNQKFISGFESILFANLVVQLTVLFVIFYNVKESINLTTLEIYYTIGFGITLFLLIKTLVQRLISSVLNIDFIVSDYLFLKINFKNFVGLLLIPINFILIFSLDPHLNHLYIIGSILFFVHIIGLSYFFKTHLFAIKNNLFYFILYLCTLEISPYVVLYKLITTT
ncbi:DUF4271 domain-containing protein [Bizionia gelidisalsuginis]|uniref:DUF4271 domain-containing protein n=2 Tax=Bizionia TaxID=283785 RepID=A0A8H2LK66_9FLAO|nr:MULTISPECIES: DUF4271 domain-containing protein [Bizionia]TYB70670.1 DUF4271 domain-containing protein [Bizionia saleffrena]TYC10202.1 DUF4271 domain-containing protein [Bizionia gelidisalsuginis]